MIVRNYQSLNIQFWCNIPIYTLQTWWHSVANVKGQPNIFVVTFVVQRFVFISLDITIAVTCPFWLSQKVAPSYSRNISNTKKWIFFLLFYEYKVWLYPLDIWSDPAKENYCCKVRIGLYIPHEVLQKCDWGIWNWRYI